ncbi:carbon storage regulator [Candidatus Parcubacteria bacterium]|nr:carbon storage regulator [Candidatus Parcubacteria bacterium]
MLIIGRKVRQTIVIGDGIEVTVVRLRGGQVGLGIKAPREVSIIRQELIGRPRKGEKKAEEVSEPNEPTQPAS